MYASTDSLYLATQRTGGGGRRRGRRTTRTCTSSTSASRAPRATWAAARWRATCSTSSAWTSTRACCAWPPPSPRTGEGRRTRGAAWRPPTACSPSARRAGGWRSSGRPRSWPRASASTAPASWANKGYVVTFRQVDPLFTFDLSDPAHPRKVGELKVPGFSTLHPPAGREPPAHHRACMCRRTDGLAPARAEAVHLRRERPGAPEGDVTQLVGNAYGWSEALYEHKAFNYFPAKGLLAIPFSDWTIGPTPDDYWSSFRSELRVFRVDAASGFTPVGAVSMTDMYQVVQLPLAGRSTGQPTVRRSVMADDYRLRHHRRGRARVPREQPAGPAGHDVLPAGQPCRNPQRPCRGWRC